MMTIANFQEIETLLSRLLQEVAVSFSAGELAEVSDFIDVGEYGLALQTFVDVVVEEDRRISPSAIQLVEELASRMEISGDIDWETLRKAVD